MIMLMIFTEVVSPYNIQLNMIKMVIELFKKPTTILVIEKFISFQTTHKLYIIM